MKMKRKPCEATSEVLNPILSQGVQIPSFGNTEYVASRKSIVQEVLKNHYRSPEDQRSAAEEKIVSHKI